MHRRRLINRGLTVVLLGSFLFCLYGCQLEGSYKSSDDYTPEQVGESRLQLSLLNENVAEKIVNVIVEYERNSEDIAPRVMELFVRHPNYIQFLSFDKGDSSIAAGKELVVQRRGDQLLRIMLYSSSNLNCIDSGRLATLHFRVIKKAPSVVEMVADRPVFAPAAANEGLILSDPLHLWSDES